MARLKILSDDDFSKLYQIPQFTDQERAFIFELEEIDKNFLAKIKDNSVKINYILHLGYFRVSQYFFSFTFSQVREDSEFIIKTHFPGTSFPIKEVSNRQFYLNRQHIINKYKMALYSPLFETQLSNYLKSLVKQHAVPKYLFDSLLDYCHQRQIVRPAYSVLQDLISSALRNEKTRISNKLYRLMNVNIRKSLDELLAKTDLFYQFTLVRKDQKDFTTNETRTSVEKNKLLSSIYYSAIEMLKALEISEQNIVYYASLAEQYTVYKLQALKNKNIARMYLLCYAYSRFLKINDYLVSSFVYRISKYIANADVYQKDAIYQAQISDQGNRNLAANILSLNINKQVTDNQLREKSFGIVKEADFKGFIEKIRRPHFTPDYYRWQYYKNNAHAIKQNIRMIFKALLFQASTDAMQKAINFLQNHFTSNKTFSDYKFDEIPLEFIRPALKRYVIVKTTVAGSKKQEKTVDADCYEFMLYMYIEKNLRKGTVTIKDSISYKSLEDELIPKELWENNKDKILEEVKNHLISTDIGQVLNSFESLLSDSYDEVNENISSGVNNKIKIKYSKKGEVLSWKLPYKKMDDSVNNPFLKALI